FPATESSETLEANHPSNEPRVLTPTAILSELRGTENRIETAKKVLVMTEERRACVLRQELAHHPDVFRDIKLQVRENVPSPGESSTRQRVGAISLDPKVLATGLSWIWVRLVWPTWCETRTGKVKMRRPI
ncbi:hypothetical protein JG687_00015849, partial [Phytophthora cactorum]